MDVQISHLWKMICQNAHNCHIIIINKITYIYIYMYYIYIYIYNIYIYNPHLCYMKVLLVEYRFIKLVKDYNRIIN